MTRSYGNRIRVAARMPPECKEGIVGRATERRERPAKIADVVVAGHAEGNARADHVLNEAHDAGRIGDEATSFREDVGVIRDAAERAAALTRRLLIFGRRGGRARMAACRSRVCGPLPRSPKQSASNQLANIDASLTVN